MTPEEPWDIRGKDDPYHWMMTEKRGWEKEEFYETGRQHFNEYLAPLHIPLESTVVDIGCGVGRITHWMPYQCVIGTDVSRVLIDTARKDNPGIQFLVNDATRLGLQDASVDFAFSYATYQHLPDKKKVLKSLQEVYRILKPGGSARLNVRGFPGKTIGTTLLWWPLRFRYVALGLWHHLPLVYTKKYDSLYGVPLHELNLWAMALRCNFFVEKVWRESTKSLWIDVKKL